MLIVVTGAFDCLVAHKLRPTCDDSRGMLTQWRQPRSDDVQHMFNPSARRGPSSPLLLYHASPPQAPSALPLPGDASTAIVVARARLPAEWSVWRCRAPRLAPRAGRRVPSGRSTPGGGAAWALTELAAQCVRAHPWLNQSLSRLLGWAIGLCIADCLRACRMIPVCGARKRAAGEVKRRARHLARARAHAAQRTPRTQRDPCALRTPRHPSRSLHEEQTSRRSQEGTACWRRRTGVRKTPMLEAPHRPSHGRPEDLCGQSEGRATQSALLPFVSNASWRRVRRCGPWLSLFSDIFGHVDIPGNSARRVFAD